MHSPRAPHAPASAPRGRRRSRSTRARARTARSAEQRERDTTRRGGVDRRHKISFLVDPWLARAPRARGPSLLPLLHLPLPLSHVCAAFSSGASSGSLLRLSLVLPIELLNKPPHPYGIGFPLPRARNRFGDHRGHRFRPHVPIGPLGPNVTFVLFAELREIIT